MNLRQALSPVAALLIGVSILLAGQGLQGTLLPVRAGLEAFSTQSIGLIGGAYFFGFTFGCLRGGRLVGRVGHVRVFAAMTALASAAPLLHGLVVNPWVWAILRSLTGFCFAILYLVIESWLNERSTNENRGVVFSTYVMITLTVLAVGQMLTLIADPRDLFLFAIASVLVSLAAIPVVMSTSPSPDLPQTVRLNLPRLFHISPAGTVGCLVTGMANGSFWALAPVFTSGYSSNTSTAAIFMTVAVLGGAAMQWPLGYLSDRIGRRKVLIVVAAIGSVFGFAIATFADSLGFVGLIIIGGFWGAFAFPLYSIAVAHANDYAEPSEYVLVSGGLLLMYGMGAVVGPLIASTLMARATPAAMFAFAGGAHVSLLVYAIIRMLRRTKEADSTLSYTDALASAHTTSQVYEDEMAHAAEDEAEERNE